MLTRMAGAPNQVTFGDARADALRRDFTVNGLFYDPVQKQLHDWVGGEADLRAKLISHHWFAGGTLCRGPPAHVAAVRLAAQLGFEIEAATFAALQAKRAKDPRISAERIPG